MLMGGLTAMLPLQASVVITGTRVIYPASESEVTVKLFNDGKHPALVQAWIDQGDPQTTPTNAKAPFTITPPIARMDPGKSQTLRLSYTGEPLPTDRESVFYLNVLEVPPKPQAQAHGSNNWLQLAIRSRLKLFFRPDSLKNSVQDALPQLTWQLTREGGKPALAVRNPSAYYVTLTDVELRGDGHTVSAKVDRMLAPGDQQTLSLQGEPPAGAQVHLRAISELGGILEADRPLAP
ncbi:molecular chaperone [Dyella choica]|uniref:Molecular chaperone n=2 Tax=Dyella choica TaxID=1927959 RepID=A0A3S0S293_9GAMM|nr:molecular chaperone [Dyella choica]